MLKNEEKSKLYSKKSRLIIARQIESILQVHIGKKRLKKARVLDMGCSRGYITGYLSESTGQITGIDTDIDAISFAKRNLKRKNLNFLIVSAEKTPFSNESFDIVVCNQVYMYFKNPKKFFEEIFRLLRPGGVCFLGAVNKYSLTAIMNSQHFYLSYWQIKKYCTEFSITSYASYVIKRKYPFLMWIPDRLIQFFQPILPNVIWILEK